MNTRALAAEFIGTLGLVLGGCGTAVIGTELGIGTLGVSFAFGLTVLTGAYGLGHISGGHFNPAVTAGLVAGGRFTREDAPGYIAAQTLGAIGGALAALFLRKSGSAARGAGLPRGPATRARPRPRRGPRPGRGSAAP